MTVNSEEGGKYLLVGALTGVRYLTVWCFCVFPISLRHHISVRPSKHFIWYFIGQHKTPKLHSDTLRTVVWVRSVIKPNSTAVPRGTQTQPSGFFILGWTSVCLAFIYLFFCLVFSCAVSSLFLFLFSCLFLLFFLLLCLFFFCVITVRGWVFEQSQWLT